MSGGALFDMWGWGSSLHSVRLCVRLCVCARVPVPCGWPSESDGDVYLVGNAKLGVS